MNFADLSCKVQHFSYQFRDDNIHEFSFRALTPIEVDTWCELIQRVRPFVIAHQLHMRTLNDVRGVWLTPYSIQKSIETVKNLPDTLPISSALLLDDNPIAITLMQMYLRQLPLGPLQARQIFFKEEEAIAWLEQRRLMLEAKGFQDMPNREQCRCR